MKTAFCSLLLVFLVLTGHAGAQSGGGFAAEFRSLVLAKPNAFKGKLVKEQSEASTYEVKLRLSGFDLRFIESMFGNSLGGDYNKPGSQELMDQVFEKLKETSYLVKDSKIEAGVLSKGILDSDVARKINVIDTSDGNRKIAIFYLSKKEVLSVEFLGK